jgi:hypothetical protein
LENKGLRPFEVPGNFNLRSSIFQDASKVQGIDSAKEKNKGQAFKISRNPSLKGSEVVAKEEKLQQSLDWLRR